MKGLNITRVLLLDGIDKVCGENLSAAGIDVTVGGKMAKGELMEQIKLFDAVVVRSATKVTSDVLAAGAPRLKLVGRAGTGTDNIDVEAATKQGIIVMNTPGGNTLSAAEHTCALICSMGRFLPQACSSLKAEAWDRKLYLGHELYGKTLAIVGLGRIGREVSKRMQAFGMIIIGYDPFVDTATAAQWNIESLPLEQLWPRADYITLHTPLLPHTRNLVGEEVLMKKCKRGVKVVNAARGGIVDEQALLKALNDGACGGAALDVFVNEPPIDFTLCQHPKVVCTPHLGANTVEAQVRVAEEIADQIIAGSKGSPLTGLVNAQALAGGGAARPWLNLATALGQLVDLVAGEVTGTRGTVDCFGNDMALFSRYLGTAAMAGLLKVTSGDTVNLINATTWGSEYDVVLRSDSSAERYPSLPQTVTSGLKLSIVTEEKTTTVIGTIANGLPTLYSMNDHIWSTGVPLTGWMMLHRALNSRTAVAAIASSVPHAIHGLWLSAVAGTEESYVMTRVEAQKPTTEAQQVTFIGATLFADN